jgi:hypothetical protein
MYGPAAGFVKSMNRASRRHLLEMRTNEACGGGGEERRASLERK